MVAMTLGVISTINRGPKDQNLAGGILAILIGLGSFMAAYFVYLKQPWPRGHIPG